MIRTICFYERTHTMREALPPAIQGEAAGRRALPVPHCLHRHGGGGGGAGERGLGLPLVHSCCFSFVPQTAPFRGSSLLASPLLSLPPISPHLSLEREQDRSLPSAFPIQYGVLLQKELISFPERNRPPRAFLSPAAPSRLQPSTVQRPHLVVRNQASFQSSPAREEPGSSPTRRHSGMAPCLTQAEPENPNVVFRRPAGHECSAWAGGIWAEAQDTQAHSLLHPGTIPVGTPGSLAFRDRGAEASRLM